MAVSIESRVPFLDHRIVEFAATIPPDIKLKDLRLKHIEREVARRFLPQEIVDRKDKQGFYPPTPLWFKRELLPMIQDILSSRSFRERGIFDVPVLERKMQDYITGKIDYSEQIWMVLNVELWHQQFIDVPAHHYHP
jgi:asparagine synthase (glutamine-hydrolysing)